MIGSIEDFVGRTLLLLWYLAATGVHADHLIGRIGSFSLDPAWAIETARIAALLLFCLLVCFMTVVRRPQKAAARGLEPRVTALLATFMLPIMGLFPSVAGNVEWTVAGTAIAAVGMALSACCLFWLGRSFSIMATARALVTAGPYGIVRHPLYACEMLAIVGITLSNISAPTVLAGLAIMGLQFRRMLNEERVLREAFPEYEAYAARVPRIVPRFGSRPTSAVAEDPKVASLV